jgi:hypothetical protein
MIHDEYITLDFNSIDDFFSHLINHPSEIENHPDYSTIRFDKNGKLMLIPTDKNGNSISISSKKQKKSFLKAACL